MCVQKMCVFYKICAIKSCVYFKLCSYSVNVSFEYYSIFSTYKLQNTIHFMFFIVQVSVTVSVSLLYNVNSLREAIGRLVSILKVLSVRAMPLSVVSQSCPNFSDYIV